MVIWHQRIVTQHRMVFPDRLVSQTGSPHSSSLENAKRRNPQSRTVSLKLDLNDCARLNSIRVNGRPSIGDGLAPVHKDPRNPALTIKWEMHNDIDRTLR